MRWLAVLPGLVLIGGPVAAPGVLRAQESPGCSPDEWFCDEPEPREVVVPAAAEPSEPEEPGSAAAPPRAEDDVEGAAVPPPTPRTERPPDPRLDVRSASPGTETDGPAASEDEWSSWAVNLRLEGVVMGERAGRSVDSGLAGAGASVRYRLNPIVTFDAGFDTLAGTDYNGHERTELALSASVLLFVNPDDVFSTYGLFGINASRAGVDVAGQSQTWSYFGGQAGLGFFVPLAPRYAMNVELVGFLRGRTDDRAARQPEFTDSSGRVSNTSGGGLFRVGLSLFF